MGSLGWIFIFWDADLPMAEVSLWLGLTPNMIRGLPWCRQMNRVIYERLLLQSSQAKAFLFA